MFSALLPLNQYGVVTDLSAGMVHLKPADHRYRVQRPDDLAELVLIDGLGLLDGTLKDLTGGKGRSGRAR